MLKEWLFFFFLLTMLSTNSLVFARAPSPTFTAKHLVFSKDKSQLIYLSSRNNSQQADIIKINAKNGKLIKKTAIQQISKLKPFAATPDGYKILATTVKGIAVIHNGSGKILRTLPYPKSANKNGSSYRQSDDGVLLAMPSFNKIHLVHTGSGKNLYTIDITKHNKKWIRYPTVRAMGFSHNRRYFAYVIQSISLKKSFITIYDTYKKIKVTQLDLFSAYKGDGKIHFSKNGQYLILNFFNERSVSLLNLKKSLIKKLQSDSFSFVGFTPDDTKIIMVQPYKEQISLYSIKTAKSIKTKLKLRHKQGVYGFNVIQSHDKSLLALPLQTQTFENINQFLIINSKTGQKSHHLSIENHRTAP